MDDWTNFSARKHAPWAADGLKSVGEVVGETNARLGFVGSPWTICMYLLSGGTGDKDFHNARAKIYSNPEKAKHMLMKMGEIVGDLLADQVLHGGADAVQLYTGMVYKGPGIVKEIKKDLISILKKENIKNVSEAVGINA